MSHSQIIVFRVVVQVNLEHGLKYTEHNIVNGLNHITLFLDLRVTNMKWARSLHYFHPEYVFIDSNVISYHFACGRREQTTIKNVKKCLKISKFRKFCDSIWNHQEKCIQISTNMPEIGLEICEILRIRETTILYISNYRVQIWD